MLEVPINNATRNILKLRSLFIYPNLTYYSRVFGTYTD